MTAPTRQQRGAQLVVLGVRVPPELRVWLREYAHAHNISMNMAAGLAIQNLRLADRAQKEARQ